LGEVAIARMRAMAGGATQCDECSEVTARTFAPFAPDYWHGVWNGNVVAQPQRPVVLMQQALWVGRRQRAH